MNPNKSESVKPKYALVIEGGGMRGIFTTGVLDAFMGEKFDPFNLYIGVSSGACNLCYHIAKQYQSGFRIYTKLMVRPEFMSFKRFVAGGHLIDLDWLWETQKIEEPMDIASLMMNISRPDKKFLIVTTSVETGEPLYFVPKADTIEVLIKSTSSLPIFYRKFLRYGQFRLTDGGVSDPIPAVKAYLEGARKIVVVRSLPYSYIEKNSIASVISYVLLKRYPMIKKAIRSKAMVYMSTLDFIRNPPEETEFYEVVPPENMKCNRSTTDINALMADYKSGLEAGMEVIQDWQKGF